MNPILAIQNWYRNASPDKKKKAVLISIASVATLALMISTGSAESSSGGIDSSPLFYVGVFLKLGAVLLLITGGAVIFQRWYGSRMRHGGERQMHLVETIRLSPKQALHVVEVGGQHFLIGATDQAISMLSSVERTAPQAETSPQPATQPALNFGELFTALTQKSTPPTARPVLNDSSRL
jgi:flagellar biogenesis protein FliO